MLAEAALARGGIAVAPGADQAVDLAHEDVEVGAPLALHGYGREEQVHKHRLAAPDRSPEVDAALGHRLAEEALQPAVGRRRSEVGLQANQRAQARALRRIGPDLAGGEAGVVGGLQHGGHAPRLAGAAVRRKERPKERRWLRRVDLDPYKETSDGR